VAWSAKKELGHHSDSFSFQAYYKQDLRGACNAIPPVTVDCLDYQYPFVAGRIVEGIWACFADYHRKYQNYTTSVEKGARKLP
jgi:hypothetical protein